MDGELWPQLYQCIRAVDRSHLQSATKKYSDATIVAVYYWSVLHDRPTCWACDERDWWHCPLELRPKRLPSQPTMSRRLKHDAGVRRFLIELEHALGASFGLVRMLLVILLDGKPLPVGRYSKDPDADFGRGAGGRDKGYKLHTLWTSSPIPIWEVRPMNVAETTVALRLVSQLQPGGPGGYVLADKNYDSTRLHTRVAAKGRQLVAPPKRPLASAGRGHRRQEPARLHALELLKRPMGHDLRKLRVEVERDLGNLVSFAGGLAPLPAWVRRLDRVRRWVQAKLVINALRVRRLCERKAA
jgi:hypothetical protein